MFLNVLFVLDSAIMLGIAIYKSLTVPGEYTLLFLLVYLNKAFHLAAVVRQAGNIDQCGNGGNIRQLVYSACW